MNIDANLMLGLEWGFGLGMVVGGVIAFIVLTVIVKR